MTGPALIVIGLILLAVGAARYLVARPQPGKKSTAFDRGDFIASRVLLGGGLALVAVGAVLTMVDLFS
jgi:hypothetical protein